jgi:hypothetical protein
MGLRKKKLHTEKFVLHFVKTKVFTLVERNFLAYDKVIMVGTYHVKEIYLLPLPSEFNLHLKDGDLAPQKKRVYKQ